MTSSIPDRPPLFRESLFGAAQIARVRGRSVALRLDFLPWLTVLLGALLRFFDVNWDQGTHIHPDERFLTMMGTDLKLPRSPLQYFDPSSSPLNPYNYASYKPMVYGTLPVSLTKFVSVVTNNDNFGQIVFVGRVLSGLADLGTLIFVYLIARFLVNRAALKPSIAYMAPAIYAICVLPVQLSHFFAVDTFLSFFAWGSVYFALRYSLGGQWLWVVASGASFGLSLACKVTGLYVVPLLAYLLALRALGVNDGNPVTAWRKLWGLRRDFKTLERVLEDLIFLGLVMGVVAYLAARLGDPYYFRSANPLDPRLGTDILSNLQQLNAFNNPAAWYPPGVQWVHKPPITFALVNLAVFGLGVPIFLTVVSGAYVVIAKLWRTPLVAILIWTVLLFLYQSTQYVKTMRYFVLLYPAMAILAAVGLVAIYDAIPRYFRPIVTATLLIWPLAFMAIYTRDHSRVTATKWMYTHMPSGSVILNEEWDDPLPLQGVDSQGKIFPGTVPAPKQPALRALLNKESYIQNGQLGLSLPVFHQGTPSKWADINYLLKHANYLVLSSNRGWGSMPTQPERYGRMGSYYSGLLSGKFGYRLVADITSYPSLRYLGIPIDFPDQWAEEAFTVYDHPEVLIFKHVR